MKLRNCEYLFYVKLKSFKTLYCHIPVFKYNINIQIKGKLFVKDKIVCLSQLP